MSEELKPCPFCGEPPTTVNHHRPNGGDYNLVHCYGCQLELDIESWNTRQEPKQLTVEELQEIFYYSPNNKYADYPGDFDFEDGMQAIYNAIYGGSK